MDILAALRQEEAKWKKQVSTAQQQLETVRAAMKLFGSSEGEGETLGPQNFAQPSTDFHRATMRIRLTTQTRSPIFHARLNREA